MLAVTNIALRDEREEQIGHKIRAMSTLTAAARRAKAELEVGGVMEESVDAGEEEEAAINMQGADDEVIDLDAREVELEGREVVDLEGSDADWGES